MTTSTYAQISRTRLILLLISYLMFILLGLTDALRGVAFPSIRTEYGLPLNAIGSLLIVGTIGYGAASFYTGKLVGQIGLGRLLFLSAALRAAGGIAFALVPTWELTLVAAFLIGVGGGMMDTGGNIYIAESHGPTIMFWLHASFGIGATLGPLLMTSILGLDQSWRLGYAIVGAVNLLLALVFVGTLPYWQRKPKTQEDGFAETAPNPRAALSKTLTLPMVWISIGIYILYTGVEVAAADLSYPLLTESRQIDPLVAGVWISVYWGTFTIGRIAAGFISRWLNGTQFIRLSLLLAILGTLVMWWNPFPEAGVIGLAMIGFGLAPLFPALISNVPDRVSAAHVANTIGIQVAAASVGIMVIPGITAEIAQRLSLETVPVVFLVVCVGLFVLHEIMLRLPRQL